MTNTNTSCLEYLKISHHLATVAGTEYVITTGTGEGTFAYLAEDVSSESQRFEDHYNGYDREYGYTEDFCAALSPEDGRDLAIALAAIEDTRIDLGGICTPVLSDEDYALVRATADALRLR